MNVLLALSGASAWYGAPAPNMDYPTAGTNRLAAGGGGSCSYRYSDHKGTPIVTSAKCDISTRDLDKGTEPGTAARTYVRALGEHDGCTSDDAGHILANRLGGKAVPINLFPQSPHLNRGAWEAFERDIAGCLDGGGASSATLEWEFHYSSSTRERPTSATYAVSYDGGCSHASQAFSNACTSSDEAALEDEAMTHIVPRIVASLNISCIDRASRAAGSGCIIHSHETGDFVLAADGFHAHLGTQLDVIHLKQRSANATYSTPTWCSSTSHLTAAGNLVLALGGTAGTGAALECSSRKLDLDPGDCAQVFLDGATAEGLQVCFNGRVE